MARADVVDVVGAGVEGLFSALELVEAGRAVRLHAMGVARSSASWAAGGILSPLYPWRYSVPVSRLAAWSQRHYSQFLPTLARQAGIDAEWEPSGLLILDEPEMEAAAWATAFDTKLYSINTHEIAVVEPRVRADSTAVWLPGIAHLRSPRLLQALVAYLKATGVEFYEGIEVEGFAVEHNRISGLKTAAGTVQTASCIVAAGAWTGQLLKETDITLPVQPVRGQMIAYATAPGFLQRIVMKNGVYAIPRRDGLVVVGSTLEHVGFDDRTTAVAAAQLAEAVVEFLPELDGYEVAHQWAGLRPSSPNDVPFIGEHPRIKGLYVNAGHYRNGIVMAPASARLLADLMLDREPIVDPSPYALPANA